MTINKLKLKNIDARVYYLSFVANGSEIKRYFSKEQTEIEAMLKTLQSVFNFTADDDILIY